ncbi:hypothetical protein D3C79_724500 [compost metagenome]
MHQHFSLRILAVDRRRSLVTQGMGLGQRQVPGQFQVQLHKPVTARHTRAQVMGAAYPRHTAGQRQHLLADVAGQLLIHQDRAALPGNLQGTPEDVQGDAQTENRIELRPAEARQHQRHQDAAVEQQVGAVMQRVSAHRGRAGDADHLALEHQQGNGQHQR